MGLSDTIKEFIQASEDPVTIKEIDRHLKKLKLIKGKWSAEDQVRDLVNRVSVFEHPAKTVKGRLRFSFLKPEQIAGDLMLALVVKAGAKPLTPVALKKKLKGYGLYGDEALGKLQQQKKIFLVSLGKKELVFRRKPLPSELYTDAQKNALKKLVRFVKLHREGSLELQDVMRFLDGSESQSHAVSPRSLIEEMLPQWYKDDLALTGGSKNLKIPHTWQRYSRWCEEEGYRPDLEVFHEVLKGFEKQGKVSLIHHDFPANIPSSEKELLFKNSLGFVVYFWRCY